MDTYYKTTSQGVLGHQEFALGAGEHRVKIEVAEGKNENIADEMISGRACVVELAELKAANMEAEYEAIEIPELEGEGNSVEGLISQFPVELNTPDVNNDKMSLGVWLNTGETIISVIVPASAFESRPKTVGAPVVANKREDGKWLFCSKFRRIQVRALWKVED